MKDIFTVILIFICIGLIIFYGKLIQGRSYIEGWNAAINATPMAVMFNAKALVYSLPKDQLPHYADNKPFVLLEDGPLTSYGFSHNGEIVADTLYIYSIIPKRKL